MRAKKCVSLLLSVCMVAGMLATTGVGASAAEGKVISNVSFSGVVNPKAGDTINVVTADPQDGLYETESYNWNSAMWQKVLYEGSTANIADEEQSTAFDNDSIYCLSLSAQVNSADGYTFSDNFRFQFPNLTVAASKIGDMTISTDNESKITTAKQNMWFRIGNPKASITYIDKIEATGVPAPVVGELSSVLPESSVTHEIYGNDKIKTGSDAYTAKVAMWKTLGNWTRPENWAFSKEIAKDAVGYPVDGYSATVQFTPASTGYKFEKDTAIVVNGKETGKTTADVDQHPIVSGNITWYTVFGADAKNGYVTFDKDFATSGDTVTVTGHPNSGYELFSLEVKEVKNTVNANYDKSQVIGSVVSLTKNENGTYSFKMPESAVLVSATFAAPHTHVLNFTPAKAATCTEDGNKEYYTCSICGKMFADGTSTAEFLSKDEVKVAKLGHKWSEWTIAKPVVGNQVGERYRTCSVCHEVEKETLYGNQVTITFDASGGKCDTKSMKTKENGALNKLPTATREGFTFDGWYTAAGTKITEMTGFAVDTTVYAHWAQIGQPIGNVAYLVLTDQNTKNGSLQISPIHARQGENVTVIVNPDTGYKLKSIAAFDAKGVSQTMRSTASNSYTFIMPGSNVTISPVFEAIQPVKNPCPSAKFTDVDTSKWYHEGIDYVVEKNIMNGVSDNQFAPNGIVTRAMLVTTLHRIEGMPLRGNAGFHDVQANSWYSAAVNWAAGAGIVNGTSATTFSPNDPLTREQMATILYRYYQYKRGTAGTDWMRVSFDFKDADKISPYAREAMRWANKNGIIFGVGENVIDPLGSTTRAQLASILMRYANTF